VQYLRTEESGPLFEKMGAKLAGIASQTGMENVFQLRGADVYRVLAIDELQTRSLMPPKEPNLLPAVRETVAALTRAPTLEALFDVTLLELLQQFGIEHSMLLLRDEAQERLFIVASHGYTNLPVGAEVPVGKGVIGVAAKTGVPIRISHAVADRSYAKVVRTQAQALLVPQEDSIPFHGLANPGSQLALPIRQYNHVMGILYVEDMQPKRFNFNHEDALATVVDVLATCLQSLQESDCGASDVATELNTAVDVDQYELVVRFHEKTATVFINNEYVIKGLAGAILWKLINAFCKNGRTQFSSRELRVDASLNLPDITDNLATRLLLLQRRLDDMNIGIHLQKCGRGKVELQVRHRITLNCGD
jgi:putative methionine-R-sulfoxide reductase with GAF domain